MTFSLNAATTERTDKQASPSELEQKPAHAETDEAIDCGSIADGVAGHFYAGSIDDGDLVTINASWGTI